MDPGRQVDAISGLKVETWPPDYERLGLAAMAAATRVAAA
jgi:hypothetical protein